MQIEVRKVSYQNINRTLKVCLPSSVVEKLGLKNGDSLRFMILDNGKIEIERIEYSKKWRNRRLKRLSIHLNLIELFY